MGTSLDDVHLFGCRRGSDCQFVDGPASAFFNGSRSNIGRRSVLLPLAEDDFVARFVRFFFATGVRGLGTMLKKFKDLTEKEILAIAIAAEEEDGRIYGEFADALRDEYPSTAQMFEAMREEEVGHRDRLFAMFRHRFGDHIPLIRRENVKGFLTRKPVWLVRPLGVKVARKQAELMELEASRFYARAASRTTDISTQTVFVASGATGLGWIDGWLGFDAGANFCRGIRFT